MSRHGRGPRLAGKEEEWRHWGRWAYGAWRTTWEQGFQLPEEAWPIVSIRVPKEQSGQSKTLEREPLTKVGAGWKER